LRLIDNIEQIGHSDTNIEWSSDEVLNWLSGIKTAFELFRTLIFSWTISNFFELYSKCFELHNYGLGSGSVPLARVY